MSSRAIRGPIRYDWFQTVLSGNYTVVNESVVVVNKTVGAPTTITLPPSQSALGQVRELIVIDGKGDANTNNITISPAGADTINGGASFTLSANYGVVRLFDCGGGDWVATLVLTAGSTLAVGASGTAGEVDIYPATSSKGKVSLTTSNNSGNTTTNMNFAAQAGARTYTVPDAGGNAKFMLAPETEATNGLFATPLRFLEFKNVDGTVLTASASSTHFGLSITLGTSFALSGTTSNNSTATNDAIVELVLPPWYIAGQNLTVTVNAAINTAGSPTYATKTAQILAYKTASDGTQGSDIGPGSASAITVAGADITFTITGTTLNPGDRLTLKLETILHDTGAVACNTLINSVRVS